jgi:hypothetical protein
VRVFSRTEWTIKLDDNEKDELSDALTEMLCMDLSALSEGAKEVVSQFNNLLVGRE